MRTKRDGRPPHARRRLGLLGTATATALALSAAPALATPDPHPPADRGFRFELPEPTGRHDVGVTELHLVDADRADPWVDGARRELMVSVWYPARRGGGHDTAPYLGSKVAEHVDRSFSERVPGIEPGDVDFAGVRTHAREGAPVAGRRERPVVLYSPGLTDPRAYGTVAVEELASRGYVVVTVDHTHETAVEFPGGRVEEPALPEMSTEAVRTAVDTRTRDTRFVLDELEELAAGDNPDAGGRDLPRGLGAALDLSSVGMFGHSAGGLTAGQAMLHDRRVDAGVNLDGSLAYHVGDEEWAEVTEQGLDRPFMLMGAGLSGSSGAGHHHGESPDWARFWANSTGWQRDLYLERGEHYSHTDAATFLPQVRDRFGLDPAFTESSIGTAPPRAQVAATRAYVPAFFDQHLRGRHQHLLDGPSPRHPEIDFIW